jgi:outer membrane protein assembly factor BamD
MKMRLSVAILGVLALAAFLQACGKEELTIGKGNPEDEIRQCLRLSSKGKHEDAIQCLEMYKARYPKSRYGQEAELLIGDSYFERKDYLLAAESYAAFIRLYPTHPKTDYAHYRIGLCYFKESPKAIDRDQEYLNEAIVHLRAVVRRYPNSKYHKAAVNTLREARTRVAKRQYYIGRFYFRTGEYIASIPRFMEVAERYPDSGLAAKSLYMVVRANLGLSRVAAARAAFSELSVRYPDSEYTKKAERKMLHAVKKEEKKV